VTGADSSNLKLGSGCGPRRTQKLIFFEAKWRTQGGLLRASATGALLRGLVDRLIKAHGAQ
jgi:hypothetical protein